MTATMRWTLVLPDGARIPYQDGKAKTFEEKLAAPDVEDAFSIPYKKGPIAPITGPVQIMPVT